MTHQFNDFSAATAQEIVDRDRPCTTRRNGSGARCTCRVPCANWSLRARGFKQEDPDWDRPKTGDSDGSADHQAS